MRIHCIFHAPFEKLGVIQDWIDQHQYSTTATHTYKGEALPDTSAFDLLIVMGGPQSAVHLDQYPYLYDEIALVKNAIQKNKAILGICLGAQIIGEALGAKAEHSPHKEIGMYPIEATEEAAADPIFKQFTQSFDVMHWHGDMPGIAKDAVLLAKSSGCPRQAFRYGDRVYGLQFHMEMTSELIKDMVKYCSNDIHTAPYIQSTEQLLTLDLSSMHKKMHLVLDHLVQQIKFK